MVEVYAFLEVGVVNTPAFLRDGRLITHISLDIDIEELYASKQSLEDFIVTEHLMKFRDKKHRFPEGKTREMVNDTGVLMRPPLGNVVDYLVLTGVEES